MKANITCLLLIALATASAINVQDDANINILNGIKGFASGFLGEKVDDIGQCGVSGIDIFFKV